MRWFGTILKWFLMIYGSLALGLTLAVIGFFVLDFDRWSGRGDEDSHMPDPADFLRSGPGLSDLRDVREEHHWITAPDSGGYRVEMHAFHVDGLDRIDLGCLSASCPPQSGFDSGWKTGDRLTPLAKAMLGLLDNQPTGDNASWIPGSDRIASAGWYAYSPDASFYNFAPISLSLIVLHPVDGTAYWIRVQR